VRAEWRTRGDGAATLPAWPPARDLWQKINVVRPGQIVSRPGFGWTIFALLLAAAVARTVGTRQRDPSWRADEATRVAMFNAMASSEPTARSEGARAFPGDPWSADDDFHLHEIRKAWEVGLDHRAAVADVLRAVDEGVRDNANQADPAPLLATVPPCHPRPDY
jgi:hypothetical protein